MRSVGAVNTVVFGARGPEGYNTDLTGFIAAHRNAFGSRGPGAVALIGAGGVGKAVAFGLITLGATAIRITDIDAGKAAALAGMLKSAGARLEVTVAADPEQAVRGADGVINCTPLGMAGYEGTPVAASELGSQSWAFDAVYTPVDTTFLRDAAPAGLQCLSGYELFFCQGIQAFKIFTGLDVPEPGLRRLLRDASL